MNISTFQRGYTLLELIITMVIISVLAVAASSSIIDIDKQDDSSARQQVLSITRTAQKYAIARRSSVYVIVANSQVRACYDAACTSPVITIDGSNLKTDTFNNKFSATNSTIQFKPNGDVVSGSIVTVGSYTLNIESGSGYAY